MEKIEKYCLNRMKNIERIKRGGVGAAPQKLE